MKFTSIALLSVLAITGAKSQQMLTPEDTTNAVTSQQQLDEEGPAPRRQLRGFLFHPPAHHQVHHKHHLHQLHNKLDSSSSSDSSSRRQLVEEGDPSPSPERDLLFHHPAHHTVHHKHHLYHLKNKYDSSDSSSSDSSSSSR